MNQQESTQPTGGEAIIVKGARVNNLKNISLSIPRGKLVVITGLSGSGKSSLAFDTLYAEGQRRYVESLSAYARQFLGRMRKPECDLIAGVPPAIAIEQRIVSRNPRSTVATSTEIYEYMRLLFARVGHTISPTSGEEVKKHTVADLVNYAIGQPVGTKLYLLVELHAPAGRSMHEHLQIQQQQGYTRLFVSGEMKRIEDFLTAGEEQSENGSCDLLIDRLVITETRADYESRLADSAETAFFEGHGACRLHIERPDGSIEERMFSNVFEADGRTFQEPSPEMFSFNNPIGACPTCEGFGRVMGIDEDLVVPNKSLSVYEECVACWIGPKSQMWKDYFIEKSVPLGFPIHKAYKELSDQEREMLWRGVPTGEPDYPTVGIDDYFGMLQREMHKIQNRVRLAHFRGKAVCPDCRGQRLKPDALCVRIGGKNISELTAMTVEEATDFFGALQLSEDDRLVGKRLLEEIGKRLQFLLEVGLGYLTLDRLSNTLSGGESQRISLATQLGSSLVGSLYVLDEPSIGLHQRDTNRLIGVLKRLRDIGNTVVVVEHDEETIRAADYLIDIGPKAGRQGGEVVYAGEYSRIDKDTPGYTAAYLTGRERIEVPTLRRLWHSYIEIAGAAKHNLRGVNVRFPLHVLTVVTGVSGSGKSTLVRDLFYEGVKRAIEGAGTTGLAFDRIGGDIKAVKDIQYVDQNNFGRSTRSNPVTYIGAYDEIRKLYSTLPLSKQMGYQPYYFSFNKEGGRCEACKGDGSIVVEMQFMADITLECEECHGKRFRKEILDVEYCGANIYDLLEMTVNQAVEFFSEHPKAGYTDKIIDKLECLREVGLGYIKLGQSSSTLSGGENQRVKLAAYLGQAKPEPTLFIFDEPTTGLHIHDIRTLLRALNALIDKGHSVVVVEHNMEMIKSADYIIDLGPDGGAAGGSLVATGTPEEVMLCQGSYTGQWLQEVLTDIH
ncbi:excinuclease ABC subunit UvrA [Porphyromonas loveana]|uniref:excinuclease ABC subunit UvrA n=1 Tax=Porphyromonas loveana TaxID=1884669 RepID=UPI0035A08A4C